jgi:hypothetical protein
MLFDAVDQLQEGNLTSYANALEFAFESFKKVSVGKTPRCVVLLGYLSV